MSIRMIILFVSIWLSLFEMSVSIHREQPKSAWQLFLGLAVTGGCWEMFRGNEYCKMLNRKQKHSRSQHKHNAQTHTMYTDIRGLPSGVLSGDVQFPLGDVNSFGSWLSTSGYYSSQRREGDRCMEEAVLEPRPFGGGHQRLDNRQCSKPLNSQNQRSKGCFHRLSSMYHE